MAGEGDADVIFQIAGDVSNILGALSQISASITKAADSFAQISNKANPALTKASSLMDGFVGKMTGAVAVGGLIEKGLTKAFEGIAGAVSGAVTALPRLIDQVAATGDRYLTLSQQVGVSVERLSEWSFVASQAGVSLETMGRGTFELGKRIENGGASVASALRKVKLSLDDVKAMKPEDAFEAVLAGLGDIPNAAERAAAGTALLGSRFRQFAQLTQEDFKKLRAEARSLGLVMTEEVAKMGDKFGDAQDKIAKVIEGFQQRIATTFLPAAVQLLEGIGKSLQDFFESLPFNDTKFMDGALQAVSQILPAFDALLSSLKPLGEAIFNLAEVGLAILPGLMKAAGVAAQLLAAVIGSVASAASRLTAGFLVAAEETSTWRDTLADLGSVATIAGTVVALFGSAIITLSQKLTFANVATAAWTKVMAAATATIGVLENAVIAFQLVVIESTVWQNASAAATKAWSAALLALNSSMVVTSIQLKAVAVSAGVAAAATKVLSGAMVVLGGVLVAAPFAVLGLALAGVATAFADLFKAMRDGKDLWDHFFRQRSEDELDWLSRGVRKLIPEWAKWSSAADNAKKATQELDQSFQEMVAAQDKQIAWLKDFVPRIKEMPELVRKFAMTRAVQELEALAAAGRDVSAQLKEAKAALEAMSQVDVVDPKVAEAIRLQAFQASVAASKNHVLDGTLKSLALQGLRAGMSLGEVTAALKEAGYNIDELDAKGLGKIGESFAKGAAPAKAFTESVADLTKLIRDGVAAGLPLADLVARFGAESLKLAETTTIYKGRVSQLTKEITSLVAEASKLRLRDMFREFDTGTVNRTLEQISTLQQKLQQNMAKDGLRSYEDLVKQANNKLFEMTTARMDWYEREQAIIERNRQEEIKQLGTLPAIYRQNYDQLVAAKLESLRIQQLAQIEAHNLELEQWKKTNSNIGMTPDAYRAAYERVVLELDEKYLAMAESARERVYQEIKDIGMTPDRYAEIYNENADIIDDFAKRSKDSLDGINFDFIEESRKRGVVFKSQLENDLRQQERYLSEMVNDNRVTQEQIIEQQRKVFQMKDALSRASGIKTRAELAFEAQVARDKLKEMLAHREEYTEEAIALQQEVVRGAERAAIGEMTALEKINATIDLTEQGLGELGDAIGGKTGSVLNAVGETLGQVQQLGSGLAKLASGDIIGGIQELISAFVRLGQSIGDALTRSEGEKIASDLRRQLETEAEEGDALVTKIEETMDRYEKMRQKLTRGEAITLNVVDILEQSGGLTSRNFDTYINRTQELFGLIEKGGQVGEDAIGPLNEMMTRLGKHLLDNGGLFSEQFIAMMDHARESGIELAGAMELVNSQLSRASSATSKIVAGSADTFKDAFTNVFKTTETMEAASARHAERTQERIDKVTEEMRLMNNERNKYTDVGAGGPDEAAINAIDEKWDALRNERNELLQSLELGQGQKQLEAVRLEMKRITEERAKLKDTGAGGPDEAAINSLDREWDRLNQVRWTIEQNMSSMKRLSPELVGITAEAAQAALKEFDALEKAIGDLSKARAKASGEDLDRIDTELKKLRERRDELAPNVDGIKRANADIVANYQSEFDRISRITLASFNAYLRQGKTAVEATEALGTSIDDLKSASDQFGFAGNAAFNALARWRELTAANGPLLEQVGGLNELMQALTNLGAMNVETFADMQAQGASAFEKLVEAGFSEREALEQLAPMLETIRTLHEEKGFAIDEATGKLLKQADAEGVLAKKEASTQQVLREGMTALIKVLGGELPAAWRQAADAAVSEVGRMQGSVDGLGRTLRDTDWSGWASGLIDAAGNAQDAVDGVSFGSSPGGIKEIPIQLALARKAAYDFSHHMIGQMEAAKRAVESVPVGDLFDQASSSSMGGGWAAQEQRTALMRQLEEATRAKAEASQPVVQHVLNQNNNFDLVDASNARRAIQKVIGPETLEWMKRSGAAKTIIQTSVVNQE